MEEKTKMKGLVTSLLGETPKTPSKLWTGPIWLSCIRKTNNLHSASSMIQPTKLVRQIQRWIHFLKFNAKKESPKKTGSQYCVFRNWENPTTIRVNFTEKTTMKTTWTSSILTRTSSLQRSHRSRGFIKIAWQLTNAPWAQKMEIFCWQPTQEIRETTTGTHAGEIR